MKTSIIKKAQIFLLLCTVLFGLTNYSCSSKLDSYPPQYYYFNIGFVDETGKDLLEQIPYLDDEEWGPNAYEVNNTSYTLDIIQSGQPGEKLLLAPLVVQKSGDFDKLLLTTSTVPHQSKFKPSRLAHSLSCPKIFDDNIVHEIISIWDDETRCSRIEIDGKSFIPIGTDENGFSVFKVILGTGAKEQ